MWGLQKHPKRWQIKICDRIHLLTLFCSPHSPCYLTQSANEGQNFRRGAPLHFSIYLFGGRSSSYPKQITVSASQSVRESILFLHRLVGMEEAAVRSYLGWPAYISAIDWTELLELWGSFPKWLIELFLPLFSSPPLPAEQKVTNHRKLLHYADRDAYLGYWNNREQETKPLTFIINVAKVSETLHLD